MTDRYESLSTLVWLVVGGTGLLFACIVLICFVGLARHVHRN